MIERPEETCYFCSEVIPEGVPRFTQMLGFRMQYDPVLLPRPDGKVTVIPNNVFASVSNGISAHKECIEQRINQPIVVDPKGALAKEPDGDQIPGQLKITDE